jgi:hypothetical protein
MPIEQLHNLMGDHTLSSAKDREFFGYGNAVHSGLPSVDEKKKKKPVNKSLPLSSASNLGRHK